MLDGIVGTLPGLPPNGLTGAAASDQFGTSAADAGDVNGDGFDDVIVGAPYNDAGGSTAGRAYVYLGGPVMDTAPYVTLTGATVNDYFGYAVAGIGDANGDGFDDVVVGAPLQDSGGTDHGRTYVYFGGAAMNAAADVVSRGQAAGDLFGSTVSSAGDVNGDGYADIAVGAYGNDAGGADAGRAYVFFGGAAMNSTADATMTGEAVGDSFGIRVACAGDVDGDGTDDVLVGAVYNDAGGSSAGRAYLYLSTYPAAAPRLAAVRDVPDDQGGFVTVEWTRSAYDGEGDGRVLQYVVERSRPPNGGGLFWETIATVAALGRNGYSAVVPTYGVPAEGTSTPVVVRVTALTANTTEQHMSGTATGASIDNIAPPPPLAPVAAPDGATVRVSWTAPAAPDLNGYAVYRSATSGFTPDSTTFLSVADDEAFIDDAGGTWFYRITAWDVNGNEGEASAEASATVVSTEGGDLPTVFALSAPTPNPASGAATLRYALPEASAVTVAVYDVRGREVARVVDSERPAGYHAVTFDARRLAAGADVVRMTAGAFVATQRLTVVR